MHRCRHHPRTRRRAAVSNRSGLRNDIRYPPAGGHRMSATSHVLLIEDAPGIVDTLRQVLLEEGYSVTIETRGDDGLARAIEQTFHVVITDLKLPGMDGLEIVRQLHASQ